MQRRRLSWTATAAAVAVTALLSACVGTPAVTGVPTVLVVGDSLSDQLAGGLQRIASGQLTTVNGGVGGCGVGPGEIEVFGDGAWYPSTCPNWAEDWQTLVNRYDPEIVVLHTGFWESFDRRVDGQVLPFGSPEDDAVLLEAYERAVQILGSRGARIVWLTTPCFAPSPWYGQSFEYADWKIEHINDLYEGFTASHPQTTLVDYRPPVCPGDQYAQVVNGVTVRPDDGIHYTAAGEDLVARWLLPQLVQLTG